MKYLFPSIAALVLLLVSCQQAPVEYVHRVDTLYIRDTLHVPDTNALKLKGTLHGKAFLYDYGGIATDNSGILVTMEGTPYSAITDAAGNWEIHDLPTSTYNIVYSKEGFGTPKLLDFQFVGGKDIYSGPNQMLPRIPNEYQLSDLRVKVENYGQGNVWSMLDVTLTPRIAGMYAWIFAGRDSTVSSNPSTHSYSAISTLIDPTTGTFIYYTGISAQTLYQSGFKKGDVVFVVAYPLLGQTNSRYWDPKTEQYVYYGLGAPSNVIRIVVP